VYYDDQVLEIYSDYINNFSRAMELVRLEAKRKSAFADFLNKKRLESSDRLNLFGLMVKPIQRWEHFLLGLVS
jgi:Rho guanine nucleotide exchange factor 10